MSATLRDRLRSDTAEFHGRLDDAFAALDLRKRRELTAFFRANHAALAAIRVEDGRHADDARKLRTEMARALSEDLAQLGAGAPDDMPCLVADARSALYILLGSRAGTAVLRGRWRAAANPDLAAAGRYFDLDPRRPSWRSLCAELSAADAHGPAADRTVADATRLFDHYHASWHRHARSPEAMDA